MTPQEMSALHGAAFDASRAWSEQEIADLLASPLVFACFEPDGFALGRVVADESELLTLAVHPKARRRGQGRALLDAFERESLRRGAARVFLEVAEDNINARALYESAAYRHQGTRPAYYTRTDGSRVAACLLDKQLT